MPIWSIAEKHGAPAGEVAIVNYGAGPSSLRDRIQGCNEVLDSYPDIELVATKVGDFTTTRQLNDSLDLLTTFPNLRGIFDDALFGGLGTGQALKETGKADDIIAVTFDSSDELINYINDGTLKGLIIQDPWGMGNMGVKGAFVTKSKYSIFSLWDKSKRISSVEQSLDFSKISIVFLPTFPEAPIIAKFIFRDFAKKNGKKNK